MDVIDSIPKLMRGEKNIELQKVVGSTEKYTRYLELTAKRTNSIAFTIQRLGPLVFSFGRMMELNSSSKQQVDSI